MEGAAEDFGILLDTQVVQKRLCSEPSVPFIPSARFAKESLHVDSLVHYFSHQIVSPVDFAKSLNTLLLRGIDLIIEIGPKAILTSLASHLVKTSFKTTTLLSPAIDGKTLSDSYAVLFASGIFDRIPLIESGTKLALPTTAFEGKSYWPVGLSSSTGDSNTRKSSAESFVLLSKEVPLNASAGLGLMKTYVISNSQAVLAWVSQLGSHFIGVRIETSCDIDAVALACHHFDVIAIALTPHFSNLFETAAAYYASLNGMVVKLNKSGALKGTKLLLAHVNLQEDLTSFHMRLSTLSRGIVKACEVELPDLSIKFVHFDSEMAFKSLFTAELLTENYDQSIIHYVNGTRFCPKLEKQPVTSKQLSLTPGKVEVIIGGLGGIGKYLIRWLHAKGARKFAIMSRKPDSNALGELKKLEGSTFKTYCVDISNKPSVLSSFCATIESMGPIGGIFHSAGVFRAKEMDNLTAEDCFETFSSKIGGSWNLHEISLELHLELEHFVLFSSVSSIIGQMRSSAYSAANSFQSDLISVRTAQGLPGTCIHWGWWNTGMAEDEKISSYLSTRGFKQLDPHQALRKLESAMTGNASHIVIMDADWKLFKSSHLKPYMMLLESPNVGAQRSDPSSFKVNEISTIVEESFKEVCFRSSLIVALGIGLIFVCRSSNLVKTTRSLRTRGSLSRGWTQSWPCGSATCSAASWESQSISHPLLLSTTPLCQSSLTTSQAAFLKLLEVVKMTRRSSTCSIDPTRMLS